MFSRQDQLIKKTGEYNIGRYDFLKQLIHEYTTTTIQGNKKQTLANLANFAYDPINYEHIKQLHLVDLFLSELSNFDDDLVLFAVSGLCNVSCDPEIIDYIISLNGIRLISNLLSHNNIEISLNALTTLHFLLKAKKNIDIPPNILSVINTLNKSNNKRIQNLSKLFQNEHKVLFESCR